MTNATIGFILQGGNLALLAVVLAGIYRLVSALLPLIKDGVDGLAEARAAFARLETKVDKLDGRGVCPLLEQRERERERPTNPEVVPEGS